VQTFTLANAAGLSVRFMAFGGIIVSLHTPDRDGIVDDVVLGFDSLEDYAKDGLYVGALIGRYANRIARGEFTIDGERYTVTTRPNGHHLHGGRSGFHKAIWNVAMAEPGDDGSARATLTHTSPDGDEGYPGTLNAAVTYTVTPRNELVVDFRATTDRPTPVSMTQHSYFNLAGHDRGDVLDHELTLNASRFTPVDGSLIPTGEMLSVCGTPFDFTHPRPIGARIDANDAQIARGDGYDHNFVIDRAGAPPDEPVVAARLYEPRSGRALEVLTTAPGIQVYSGNGLNDRVTGKQWRVYRRRCGIALEPQRFPDSPNRSHFPPCILRPDEEYRSRTIYRFSVGRM
jgi:aldose 1-epimerase